MRTMLMWTMSYFYVYDMLSDWMSHARMACPYCLNNTQAFCLNNGRRHNWFNCHRKIFLHIIFIEETFKHLDGGKPLPIILHCG